MLEPAQIQINLRDDQLLLFNNAIKLLQLSIETAEGSHLLLKPFFSVPMFVLLLKAQKSIVSNLRIPSQRFI